MVKFCIFFTPIFLLTLINAFILTACFNEIETSNRKALEIVIGIGGGGGGKGNPVIGIGGGGGGGNGNPPQSPPPGYQNCPPSPYIFESQRIKLVYPVIQRFKQKIKCDPLNVTKTWNGPDICHSYKGFFCDTLIATNERALAGVTFNGYNFDGPDLTVDGFIDQLPDIIVFHANSNSFKGGIPATISQMRNLFELDLSNNKYSGVFPHQVLAATQLTFLDLRFNSFSGLVPAQVFNLQLDVLFLNNNVFPGQPLPESIGSTPALYVTLANNMFTGPIPASIGRARKTLIEILLLNNRLSGCLPCEIGLLERATLFDASRNLLTGPIPKSFGCLGKMEFLNLADNCLYGAVPESVCRLPNLVELRLSGNYFTAIGPECRKLMARKVLDVRMNCLPGLPTQRSAAECRAFFAAVKPCPNQGRFGWVPCGGKIRRNAIEEVPEADRQRRSYEALIPRRL